MVLSVKQMVAEARANIRSLKVPEAVALLDDADTVFVDVRDVRELDREGMIPGAVHAPRGMLEFWVDPESPYHRPVFSSGKRYVFYCALGWRSALATDTARRLGLADVADIEGGFTAWREAGAPVAERPRRDEPAKPRADR